MGNEFPVVCFVRRRPEGAASLLEQAGGLLDR
jgi:hypothetical protein